MTELNTVSSGNIVLIASSVSCVIGLTWGGVKFEWTSAQVLAPLVLGLVGMCGFLVYEATVAKEPVVSCLLMMSILVTQTLLRSRTHSFLIVQVSVGE